MSTSLVYQVRSAKVGVSRISDDELAAYSLIGLGDAASLARFASNF